MKVDKNQLLHSSTGAMGLPNGGIPLRLEIATRIYAAVISRTVSMVGPPAIDGVFSFDAMEAAFKEADRMVDYYNSNWQEDPRWEMAVKNQSSPTF